MSAVVIVCAWCEAGKPEPDQTTGDHVSHGICAAHRRAEFLAPKLYGCIARLRSPGWLSCETRAEMASELERVVKALEMEGPRVD